MKALNLRIFVISLILLVLSYTGFGQGQHAKFEVTYKNFPPEAEAAFQYAVDIWSSIIYSPVTITIDAEWADLGENQGGHCVAGSYHKDFDGAIYEATLYPVALAEKLAGKEINDSSEPDIIATFNSSETNWYYGTDGNTPDGKHDLVTVVLHEIAHGLGIFGSMTVENNKGLWGGGTNYPTIFERFIINANQQQLIDTTIFANNSDLLYQQILSDNLYFKSETAKLQTGDYPKLFAPATFYDGSSIFHLDEDTYPANTENALMTPKFNDDVIHHPGEITLAILADIGWINTYITHTPLADSEDLSTDFTVTASIIGDTTLITGSYILHYSLNNFQSEVLEIMQETTEENIYSAVLPGVEIPLNISYYISVQDVLLKSYTSPAGAPTKYHTFFVGSDDEAPSITHEPVVTLTPAETSLELTAEIVDNTGIASVIFEYNINGENTESIELTTNDGFNYAVSVDLAGKISNGDAFNYRFIATDISSNANQTTYPSDGFHQVQITDALEEYANDFNESSSDFFSDYFTVSTPDGFENGALHSKHPYEGTGIDGQLISYTTQLKYPIKVATDNARMSFDEIVLVEPGQTGIAFGENEFWDYVIVEASKDNGETWVYLLNGYDARQKTSWLLRYNSDLQTEGRNQNSKAVASPDLYENRVISLNGMNEEFVAGDKILIRFRLFSDPFSTGWGWAIDNLQIQTQSVGIREVASDKNIEIYPNPFTNTIYVKRISIKRLHKIRLLDLNGKLVFAKDNISNNYIDLPELPKGVYIIQLVHKSGIINKKIVKN